MHLLGYKRYPIVPEFFQWIYTALIKGTGQLLKARATQKLPGFFLVGSLEIAFESELELEPWLSYMPVV